MEIIAGVVMFLAMVVVAFLLCLIPTWLVMLAYNYLVSLMGHVNWEVPVTFWSVVCVAVIFIYLRNIFGGTRK